MPKLPQIIPKIIQPVEIPAGKGMDNTTHPSILPMDVPTNLENTFFRNGIWEKRGGSVIEGDYLTAKHSENFTTTTQKDATNTTADWSTDGIANLFNYSKTIDTSTSQYATGFPSNRHVVNSTNGTIVVTYQDGSGIKARKSTDKGNTWVKISDGTSGEDTITTDTTSYWDICIDASDNIYVAYQATDNHIHFKKLTYSSGNWSVGTEKTVSTSGYKVAICTLAGNVYVAYSGKTAAPLPPSPQICYERIYVDSTSDGGTTWAGYTMVHNVMAACGGNPSSIPVLLTSGSYVYLFNSYVGYSYKLDGTWSSIDPLTVDSGTISATDVNGVPHVVYRSGGVTKVAKYVGNWEVLTTISSSANDAWATISTDNTNIWVVYSRYVSSSVYYIAHRTFNGTSWSDNGVDITGGAKELYLSTPSKIISGGVFTITWTNGSSSPYNVKSWTIQLSGVIQSSAFDSSSGSQTYLLTSFSTARNGGTISVQFADSTNTTAGTFTSDISTLSNRYIFFKLLLSTTNLAGSPYVTKVEMTYGGIANAGLFAWTRNDGAKYLITTGGTSIYVRESGTTWLQIKSNATPGLRYTAAPFQNYFILTNGTDNVMRFNGKSTGTAACTGNTTVTGSGTKWNTASDTQQLSAGGRIKLSGSWYTIQTVTNDTSLTLTGNGPNTSGNVSYDAYAIVDLAGNPPKGKYVESFRDFVWIAGNSTNPTRLYYSAQGVGTNWTVANPGAGFIDVDTDDGEIITGIKGLRDVLGIFKYDSNGNRKSVWGITGGSQNTFTPSPLTTEYSAVSGYAIVANANYVYFIDRKGIVETNYISFNRVDNIPGSSIENITKNWNQQYIDKSCGIFYDDMILFAIPYLTSTTNNVVLINDTRNGIAWGKITGINPGCFCVYASSYTPELYFGDQTSNSSIFKLFSGTSENGNSIDWVVETSEINFKQYFISKRMKYLFVMLDPTSVGDLTAYFSKDGSSNYTQLKEVISVSNSDGSDIFKRWRLPNLVGSSVKFKFENNSSTDSIKMVRFGATAESRGLRTS